jgi:hypothetical protein
VRRSRLWWTVGAAFVAVHSVAAFGIVYDWRHAVAEAATARQTAALVGIEAGAGIFVNYVCLGVWALDALWWWRRPDSYAARPRPVTLAVRGFIFFMFLNGAVVFADGWMRVLGAASVGIVTVEWCRRVWLRGPSPGNREQISDRQAGGMRRR